MSESRKKETETVEENDTDEREVYLATARSWS